MSEIEKTQPDSCEQCGELPNDVRIHFHCPRCNTPASFDEEVVEAVLAERILKLQCPKCSAICQIEDGGMLQ